jgi:hypothetical protein
LSGYSLSNGTSIDPIRLLFFLRYDPFIFDPLNRPQKSFIRPGKTLFSLIIAKKGSMQQHNKKMPHMNEIIKFFCVCVCVCVSIVNARIEKV